MSQNNDMVRSEGKTVAEAVSEALLRLGAREEEVDITVIEEGKSGLFGVLGRKAACVEVQRKPRKRSRRRGGRGRRRGSDGEGGGEQRQAQSENRQSREGGGRDQQDRSGRRRDGRDERSQQGRGRQDDGRQDGGRQDRERRPRNEEPRQQQPARDERPAAARQDGDPRPTREPRQRRERRPRDERPRDERPRDDQPRDEQPRSEAAAPQRDDEGRQPRERRERRPRNRDQRREQPVTNEENAAMEHDQRPTQPRRDEKPAAAVVSGDPLAALDMASVLPAVEGADIDETIARTAEDLLRRCGIFSRAQVTVGDDGYHNVRMVTDANSADIMAGRRNSIINSVQHLCDRIASRASGDHVKVNVDINNHRQRRDGGLAQMAEGAVNRLKETGEEQHLDPMNARERRIVHMEIAEIEGVDTTTIGEGPDRHVVIIVAKDEAAPAAAPEESSDQ